MYRTSVAIIALIVCAYLAGGSRDYAPWVNPMEYPLDYRKTSGSDVTVATMTADRRSIIIVPDALNGINADLRVCPEPPADAADNLASVLKAVASGDSGVSGGNAKGTADLSSSTTTQLASVFSRSQGLELFRDGANALCLAWLNDIYNKGDVNGWREDFRLLLNTSASLISQEITANKYQALPATSFLGNTPQEESYPSLTPSPGKYTPAVKKSR